MQRLASDGGGHGKYHNCVRDKCQSQPVKRAWTILTRVFAEPIDRYLPFGMALDGCFKSPDMEAPLRVAS